MGVRGDCTPDHRVVVDAPSRAPTASLNGIPRVSCSCFSDGGLVSFGRMVLVDAANAISPCWCRSGRQWCFDVEMLVYSDVLVAREVAFHAVAGRLSSSFYCGRPSLRLVYLPAFFVPLSVPWRIE